MRIFPTSTLLLCGALILGCGSDQSAFNDTQTMRIHQGARLFLSGIIAKNPQWACRASTPAYWQQADWSKEGTEASCINGFKTRMKNNPLDRFDYSQYTRILTELPSAAIKNNGGQAQIQFSDMKGKACQNSSMSLQANGERWQVNQFIQGRCMGLLQKK